MNILVTGGAGFIGRTVVSRLRAEGHDVTVFDNLSTGDGTSLPRDVPLIEADIRDTSALLAAAAGHEVLIHQAAMVSVQASIANPALCLAINVQGTRNALEAAWRQGVRRFVCASSASIYGDSGGGVEDLPPVPTSPYAYSKWLNEVDAAYYSRYLGLETVCLRYFNVYGPGQRDDSPYAGVISIASRAILEGRQFTIFGDGSQTRDFVFVEDVAKLVVEASIRPGLRDDVINIGRGKPIRLIDLLAEIGAQADRKPVIAFAAPRSGDVLHSKAETHRLLERLGVFPETELDAGLAITLAWMRSFSGDSGQSSDAAATP